MKKSKKFYQCECGISLIDDESYKNHKKTCGKIGKEKFDAKMKRQKGFIKIPILIIIIASTLVIGWGIYIGIEKYHDYQFKRTEKARLVAEEVERLQKEEQFFAEKEKNKRSSEIEELKKEIGILKNKKPDIITNIITQQPSSGGQSAKFDLQGIVKKWHPMVVYVECVFRYNNGDSESQSGSGTLKSSEGRIMVATNRHVLIGKNGRAPYQCKISVPFDKTYINTEIRSRDDIDYGSVEIVNPSEYIKSLPMLQHTGIYSCGINGSVGEIGTQIAILGYPGIGSGTDITVTQGIISGYNGDYYITDAKIEHGNSGGAAIDTNGNCYLGIPTAAVSGTVESLGRILKWQSL